MSTTVNSGLTSRLAVRVGAFCGERRTRGCLQGQSGGISTSDEALDGALRRLDAAVAALHAALLPNTLFMVFTGHVRSLTSSSVVRSPSYHPNPNAHNSE